MAILRFRTRLDRAEEMHTDYDDPEDRARRLANHAARNRVCADCKSTGQGGYSLCESGKCPMDRRARA